VIYKTDDYATLRGLEQIAYAQYKATAFLNKIRGISAKNPNITTYMEAAKNFLKTIIGE
jgi:hypothetical protein